MMHKLHIIHHPISWVYLCLAVSNVMAESHCAMLGENVELYRFSSALVDWTTGSPCQVEVVQGKIERCDVSLSLYVLIYNVVFLHFSFV